MSDEAILQTVARYYAEKLSAFGATPRGVDWNSAESQALRFNRLLQVLPDAGDVSLNDYGCGYGALFDYLRTTGLSVDYRGFDVSDAMVAAASARHEGATGCSFTFDAQQLSTAEYTVASGIFNVRLDCPVDRWREYVLHTLASIDGLSTRGFAFNLLSTRSDPERRRPDLYYADPVETFELCARRFSARVALLHDYPLYEFTIIVRK
jgi:SAM-dependent methyltransferase